MKGWIKLHRSLTDNWIWKSNEPFDKRSAWIDLLLMANHKDLKVMRKGHLAHRKRGEVNTSVTYLSERWGWSRNKVYRFLKVLECDNMVHISGTADGTTVTIENYTKYQVVQNDDETPNGTPNETTDETPDGTYDKNVKECKKNGKEIYKGISDELRSALRDFEDMRKRIKKPMTDRARTLLLNKLNSMADTDAEKIAILEQSIMHSWSSVYPMKGQPHEVERNDDVRTSYKERNRLAGSLCESENGVPCFEDGTPIRAYGLAKGLQRDG